MQASVIRSAVSLDSPRPSEQPVAEEELSFEVGRLQRRICVLQRGRAVLEEELQLYREELESKNRRIEQLTLQLALPPSSPDSPARPLPGFPSSPPSDLILVEQREQLDMLSEALRERSWRLEQLQVENRQLREQVANGGAFVRQIKESAQAQLSFQQRQLEALQQQLQQKDREIAAQRLLLDNLLHKESAKWQRINESLRQQLRIAEENAKNLLQNQESQAHERQQLKQRNQELLQEIDSLKEKACFLQSLLEEAKGAFIDAQLQQQEQLQREEREKREYRKRNQLLKTQLRSLKECSESGSTCEPSSKSTKSTRNSTVSVTPFRVSSCRAKQSQQL